MNPKKWKIVLPFTLFSAACSAQDAKEFWLRFQRAVVSSDKNAVAEMTQFPLEVRGVDDSIPVIQCDRRCFDGMFDRLLKQPVLFLQKDYSTLEIPLQKLIVDAKDAPQFLDQEKTIMRFHDFEFEKTANGWRIVRVWQE